MATASHGASQGAGQGPRPTPERIFATLTAYQQTAALKAAIQLDIFTKIGEGATDAAAVAKAIGGTERGARILCDYMTIQGFLSKTDGRYALTPDAAVFLDRRSPAYLGAMAGFMTLPIHHESFGALAETVRQGRCVTNRGDATKPMDAMWVEFARSMAGLATPSAEFLATVTEVRRASR
jgi:hypothetical protein